MLDHAGASRGARDETGLVEEDGAGVGDLDLAAIRD